MRKDTEVWAYGKQAEAVIAKYLKLRYALMPYLYSMGHSTYETGAPFMFYAPALTAETDRRAWMARCARRSMPRPHPRIATHFTHACFQDPTPRRSQKNGASSINAIRRRHAITTRPAR